MNFQFGIREKLLLPILIGLAIIIFILLFIWQPSQLAKEKQHFIEAQTNLLKTLAPSIIQNILANDLAELHSIFENSQLIHEKEWRYIQLNDPDNKQLYPIFSSKPEKTKTLLSISLAIEENNEIFGYITLYTDWSATKEQSIKNINQLSLIFILLFAAIAVFSFILQTNWIYTPITKLKDITSEFSKNNYDISLPKITSDEIGQLTNSIDKMRHKIQSTLSEIIDKEKMTSAILETAPDAIITMSKRGIIKSFNPGAETIFQFKANEIIGENIKVLMPDDVASHHKKYVDNFNKNESTILGRNRELFGVKKDGSQFPLEITINANIINNEQLFTGVLRDITERKKIDTLKDDFISTVSHELRTPLTAIKGSLDLINHGFNLDLPEQAATMLDISTRNVERLLSLINDILDVSKLESGEINLLIENIDVKQIIDNCIELNQEYAKKYNTGFFCTHCDENIMVNADKDRLTQVMSNLLSNAAKYSPENMPVEIFTEMNNGIVRVNVKDYGAGIPEEFQNKIFGKFTQSDSGNTRQVGGTGLGLNISKMIVEKLGGKIGFETIVDKGSTFYFEFPIATDS